MKKKTYILSGHGFSIEFSRQKELTAFCQFVDEIYIENEKDKKDKTAWHSAIVRATANRLGYKINQ